MELLPYKTPISKMRQIVREEIVASQIQHGDSWVMNYFNNFYFYFPYIRDGKLYDSYHFQTAKQLELQKTTFAESFGYEKEFLPKKGLSEKFLGMTPEDFELLRLAVQMELGSDETHYLPSTAKFFKAYDSDEPLKRKEIKKRRENMVNSLEEYYIRYRAFGLNETDLKI